MAKFADSRNDTGHDMNSSNYFATNYQKSTQSNIWLGFNHMTHYKVNGIHHATKPVQRFDRFYK